MIGDMLKSFWSSFDWKGKLVLAAIPLALVIYANTTFPQPNCDRERSILASVDHPGNAYRANQVPSWRDALRLCEQRLAAARREVASANMNPVIVRQRRDAERLYASTWTIGILVLLPLGCLLSYAGAAGRWGNAAYVKWSDFYGTPLVAFIGAWMLVHAGTGIALLQSGAAVSQGFQAFIVGSLIAAFVIGLPMALVFTHELIGELWVILKGLVMLAHYAVTSHPAEIHLPSAPDIAISRPALRDAITSHYESTSTGSGIWSFLKPRFMYEHELFRANKVEELLRADTSILQEAIRRERARAEATDQKRAKG